MLRAYQHGFLSCAEGRVRIPPSESAKLAATVWADRWLEGWDDADAELASHKAVRQIASPG
jgi:hypothetical protein